MTGHRAFPTGALLLALASTLAAQGEKIRIRPVPAPNQIIQIGMTQNVAFEAAAEGLASGPIRIEGTTTFRASQSVGERQADGRLIARMTLDSISIALSNNGVPLPFGSALDTLRGRVIVVTYDSAGKVVELSGLGDLGPAMTGMKGLMGQVTANLPATPLGIGGSVTVPMTMAMPVPGLGTGAGLEGTNTFKLMAVNQEGPDRIATLELTTDARMSGALEVQMTGGGTMRWNLSKGFVQNSTSDMKMDMTMQAPDGKALTVRGTIHMIVTGESRSP